MWVETKADRKSDFDGRISRVPAIESEDGITLIRFTVLYDGQRVVRYQENDLEVDFGGRLYKANAPCQNSVFEVWLGNAIKAAARDPKLESLLLKEKQAQIRLAFTSAMPVWRSFLFEGEQPINKVTFI